MKIKSIILASLLAATLFMCGCAPNMSVSALVSGEKGVLTQAEVEKALQDEDNAKAVRQFGAQVFSGVEGSKNTLISPLSLYSGLGLLTAGAGGDTKLELEKVLGNDERSVNEFCGALIDRYSKTSGVNIANCMWYDESWGDFSENYLQDIAKWYGADIFKAKFGGKAEKDISKWIKHRTDGEIKNAAPKLDTNSRLALINTLLFEMQWADKNYNYTSRDFTNLSGEKSSKKCFVDEGGAYRESESAKAFTCAFDNRDFSFMGVLPNADVNFADYINGFDAEEIDALMGEVKLDKDVYFSIPKFSYDYTLDASALKNTGLSSIFGENADFTRMTQSKLFVSQVSHKTRIELDKNGVKASAASTFVGAGAGEPREKLYLYLDRPFVYMIIDNITNIPLYIGSVVSL